MASTGGRSADGFLAIIFNDIFILVVIMIHDHQFYWVEHQGSPSDQFKAIDENGDGAVSFDEWLGFAYKNYQVS